MRNKDIVILGSGAGWHNCPFDKEVWAIGKLIMSKKFKEMKKSKVDLLFNMDNIPEMLSFDPKSPYSTKSGYTLEDYIKEINALGVKMITSYKHKDLKNCEEFPLKEVVEKFGIFYFTNTICFMIAYALMKGDVKSITLWGVNQSGAIEYYKERKGVEFWIGLAAGMGVEIHIEGMSHLLKLDSKLLYGYKRTQHELKEEFNIDIEL